MQRLNKAGARARPLDREEYCPRVPRRLKYFYYFECDFRWMVKYESRATGGGGATGAPPPADACRY